MSEEHPVIPTRHSAGSLMRQMLLQELTIGEGPIGQMDMLSIIANAADWLDEAVAENATTALTDAEREAVEAAVRIIDNYEDEMDGFSSHAAATLRGLLERLGWCTPQLDCGADRKSVASQRCRDTGGQPFDSAPTTTPAERAVPPEWTSRPYWVDPPEGWRWGFPRLYDPATDGDMTKWMIRQGYPERLARQELACTFTATEDGGK